MEFKDRVANKPNRVKLTYEDSGASVYARVELADESIESGTPLNKATFDELQKELNAYVVGNVLVTSTNKNPSEYLGGTWELVDKGFKHTSKIVMFDKRIDDDVYYGADGYETRYNTNCMNKMEIYYHLAGNVVRFRISCYLKPSVTFDDGGVLSFIKMDWTDFGFTVLSAGFNAIACYNDVLNSSGLLMSIGYTGTISQADVIGSSRQLTIPNSMTEPITIDFTTPINTAYMLDEFCDKFYWKRIS
jgi:hypothetical protein